MTARLPVTRPARYDVLFEPVRISPVTAKNRFYQVPHCNGMGRSFRSAMAAMRGVKAEGGWGVVSTEQCDVHYSGNHLRELRIWDARDVPYLARATDEIHRHGALAAVELVHNGHHVPNLESRATPIAPSVTATRGIFPVTAREMDSADIRAFRRWHRAAAVNAKRAGFDINHGRGVAARLAPGVHPAPRHRRLNSTGTSVSPPKARMTRLETGMADFREYVGRVATGSDLDFDAASEAFDHLTSGTATQSQMGAFLMALRMRGETVAELTAAASTLRRKMLRVDAPASAVDVVGTGGDESGSYNVSTCAAFIVAGAGPPVAKHGNRALSSRSGASDVLTALGVRIDLGAAAIGRCIAEAGIGFMFAPNHHPALRHVAATRVELGTRTIFNLLGPLLNPAGVRRHLVGVYSREWVEPLATVLGELGSERALVVHGSDGLDEITTSGPTTVAELRAGRVRVYELSPGDAGLPTVRANQLKGGDPAANAEALRAVLEGATGPYRDIAAFNAAAALVISDRAQNLVEGMEIAAKSLDSGEALARLERLIHVSNNA
ncbi:anthranilate phosphoribosyltransferase [Saccharopolyspora sp. ASAGF58]|uniref:anthranilate phosphoribosyltransferase n=1 Tax=Saccharopolyspora sp. ASAGF58 TaxID=2719023 RepID=UPI001B303B9A|nr:anthranilate phosphoribosyltransferase [Saccharopolyspora sp. ASAGF58]